MWYNGQVIKTADASPVTRRFWVEIQPEEGKEVKFSFKAGQFVTMDLPIHEKRLNRWRSYSIANAPDDSNILEFCIVRLENGLATNYLFDEIKVGSSLRFKGPEGTFVVKEPIERDMVMICTGTGVVPFRSMLWDIFYKNIPHRNIHLIYGTRHADNILYRDEFEFMTQEMPGFKYDIVLSKEENWSGYKGHVHQVYLDSYKEPRPDRHFYLCGWSNMIDEAVANLLIQLRYDRTQVHYELYG